MYKEDVKEGKTHTFAILISDRQLVDAYIKKIFTYSENVEHLPKSNFMKAKMMACLETWILPFSLGVLDIDPNHSTLKNLLFQM